MKRLIKSILMLQKGSNMALSDPKKVLLMIHDVPRHFPPKFWCRVLQIFVIGQKWISEKWCEGMKNLHNPNYLTKMAAQKMI